MKSPDKQSPGGVGQGVSKLKIRLTDYRAMYSPNCDQTTSKCIQGGLETNPKLCFLSTNGRTNESCSKTSYATP